MAERCGEARLETEAHVLLRPARTPRIDAKLRLLNEPAEFFDTFNGLAEEKFVPIADG